MSLFPQKSSARTSAAPLFLRSPVMSCERSSAAVLRFVPCLRPPLRLPQWVVSSGALLRARCVTRPAPGRPDELLLFSPICSRPESLDSSGAARSLARPPAAGVGAAVLQWNFSMRDAGLLTRRARCKRRFFSLFLSCDKTFSPPPVPHTHRHTLTHKHTPSPPTLAKSTCAPRPKPTHSPKQGSLSIPPTDTNNTESCHTARTHSCI